MLGLLLDAGLPEPQAVTLAAHSTANAVFICRAGAVVEQLAAGRRLTDAIAALDDSGEFVWRLQNAARGHGGFGVALTGWHEALEAQAYQQEQAVSQIISTLLVVGNGGLVALIAVGVFQALTTIVWEASLW
jgi:type II secretory pathway component PulF